MTQKVAYTIIASALLSLGCDAATVGPASAIAPVLVASPARAAAPARGHYAAVLQAPGRLRVVAPVAGELRSRHVDNGDEVEPGTVLFRIDRRGVHAADDEAQARVRAARARLVDLRRQLERATGLVAAGALPVARLEAVQDRHDATEAELAAAVAGATRARVALDDTVVRATTAGSITEVLVGAGTWVERGTPLATLRGSDDLRVEIRVSAAERETLAPGSTVDLRNDSERARASVAVVAEAAGDDHLFPVTIRVPSDAGFRAGEVVTVGWDLGASSPARLTVPLGAVVRPGSGRPSVWVVRDGRTVGIPIEPERLVGPTVVVGAHTLTTSDQVIVAGHERTFPGGEVTAVELP